MNDQAKFDLAESVVERPRLAAATGEEYLFFPDLDVPLPESVLNIAQQSDAIPRIRTARSHYQRGLMVYLRRNESHEIPAALKLMQDAVVTVLTCMPKDGCRAFWWLACGLLDCVAGEGLPARVDARKLFSRIDRQMYGVATGNTADAHAVMNEMLYVIGCSYSVSDRVELIKQHYAVASYLPDFPQLASAEVARVLGSMYEQYRLAEENWEAYSQGDAAAITKFIESCKNLASHGGCLDCNTLQYLSGQILAVALRINSAERVRTISMDLAMALLLLGQGIEHYSHLDDSFHEQVRLMVWRMRTALERQPEDRNKLMQLIDRHCLMHIDGVTVSLAKAMLDTLHRVRQSLNNFLKDSSRRNELTGVPHLFAQIRGGLRFLSLAEAEQLLGSIQNTVHYFGRTQAAQLQVENASLAKAVNAFENYLEQLSHGQKDNVTALRVSLDELSKLPLISAESVSVAAGNPVDKAKSPHPFAEDRELLEVFLEEAQEALALMRGNLDICNREPEHPEALASIRRGFHTLKGSGRMVGLSDFGEVAWAVERALNKWLRDNNIAVPELLQFARLSIRMFSVWVDELYDNGSVQIEASNLIEMARQIEQGKVPEAPAQTKELPVQPADEKQASIEPERVVIGGISLSSTLFGISSEEAKQNAFALREQWTLMRATHSPIIQYDFMRAAHTLAGVCRNMGFYDVADLAHNLENWLQARMEQSFTLSDNQSLMLEQTISALQEMVQCVCDLKAPSPCGELCDQLSEDKDKVRMGMTQTQILGLQGRAVHEFAPHESGKLEERLQAAKVQIHDDLDEQLLPVFLAEADELTPKIGAGLRAWHDNPSDTVQADLLKRWLHTFKGSARMAGVMRLGEIAHAMEDRVLAAAKMRDHAGYWENLEDDFDRISVMLEEFRGDQAGVAAVSVPRAEERGTEHRSLEIGAERALHAKMLRVRSDVVDRLVNEAGEISVARSRMETEVGAFHEGLLELTSSVTRLRSQLREIEIQAESQMQARILLLKDDAEHFDPLEFDRFTRLQELTRFMNESVHDVQTVQQSLLKNIDEAAAAMSAQARLNRELHQGLMNVRMVPFSSTRERLYRIVRQTGKELGKRANLELYGGAVELDRGVLEKMAAPFEHLLRNAIVHGLESEPLRIQSGKDPIGEIRLNLRQESNEVVFEFGDDGAGLDLDALREKATVMGLLKPDDALGDEQLAQLIFVSGISTSTGVTEVAGRGIGMDVVRSEITALGGRIDVSSQRGHGTQFIIHLPLTLAVTQTLMVRSGNDIYAVPSTMVEQVRQEKSAGLAAMYSQRQTVWQDKVYPLHYLPHLLGEVERVAENKPRNALLLLRSGEQRIALHVDEIRGNQEVVVKNIGPQLARLPGIAGATVQGNGAVVLILNPVQLAQRIAAVPPAIGVAAPEKLRTQPLVMVVDDSLTVRKITTRLLTRAGYQVATARDGMDALEQLGEISPDVMLLDIEMPRMDGFELIKHLRQDIKTQQLPVIIITSRTAEKHRNYAHELGVSAYMGKPYQEEALLQQIAVLVATRHGNFE